MFRSTRCHFGLCIDDINFFAKSFVRCEWSHVKRGGNTVAHNVARLCLSIGERLYVDNFPDAILALAEIDLI